jgi:hypothetical protein
MSPVKSLLVVVAAAGLNGWAGAATADPVEVADDAVVADHGSRFTSVSASYSFADIVDLPAGTQRRLPSRSALARAPEATPSELSRINHSPSARPGVVSSLRGAFDDLAGDLPVAETAGSKSVAWILFPIEEIPAPSGWMLALCGLAVAGFMARRQRRAPEN